MAQQTLETTDTLNEGRVKLNDQLSELYALGTWEDYVPTLTGYSVAPTVSVSRYVTLGKLCIYEFYASTDGTSNATTKTITLPFSALHTGNICIVQYKDNNTIGDTPGILTTRAASNIADIFKTLAGGTWTGSGNHRIFRFTLIFEIA